ncbi:restriction system modified-DNA reader domain-containing protein [Phytoactinopolyspora halotolerans]|uniref:RAMA domain-containing protein n=1 Tax=Phytoactinopolyspora halotolerans TaxID=1981512 RepID=A0A6L9S6W3_9ACTN|nr:hypothetical protein [Phytoactinopolyspora halotolerans]NEE01205.1 hypothetical protein [Phytoactinopolyspora halotolerans]
MRRIEIDDDVYAELERHVQGFERPNDVLRRLLLKVDTRPPRIDGVSGRRGKLMPLIEAGLIKPGEKLQHEQTRKGNVYEATVATSGEIVTVKGTYQAPSPALAALVGSQIDGWANWLHAPSGKTLRQLRLKLEQ